MSPLEGTTAGLSIVDEPGYVQPEGVLTVSDNVEPVKAKAKAQPLQAQNGFRAIGPRKARLLMKIHKELEGLHKRGINAKFVLNKFTSFENGIKTPTKKLTGILSQLKSFDK